MNADSDITITNAKTTDLNITSTGTLQNESAAAKTVTVTDGCNNLDGTLSTTGDGGLTVIVTGTGTITSDDSDKGIFIGSNYSASQTGSGNITVKVDGTDAPIVINSSVDLSSDTTTQMVIGSNATGRVVDVKSSATVNISSLTFE